MDLRRRLRRRLQVARALLGRPSEIADRHNRTHTQPSRRMPPPVRRKTLVLMLALGAALAFVAVAYAGNGGFAPYTPRSPNAARINSTYKWIALYTGAIFIVVEGTLIWFVVR